MWDLVPWPGIELRPPALGVHSLSHWTTREVPFIAFQRGCAFNFELGFENYIVALILKTSNIFLKHFRISPNCPDSVTSLSGFYRLPSSPVNGHHMMTFWKPTSVWRAGHLGMLAVSTGMSRSALLGTHLLDPRLSLLNHSPTPTPDGRSESFIVNFWSLLTGNICGAWSLESGGNTWIKIQGQKVQMENSVGTAVAQSCPTLCDPMDCSPPGFPVLHHLPVCSNSRSLSRWCYPTISSFINLKDWGKGCYSEAQGLAKPKGLEPSPTMSQGCASG